MPGTPPVPPRLAALAATHPGLRVLLLFGSRARGDVHPHSDWDFGYLASPGFDPDALLADLVEALIVDRVDLVDLERASGLLRFRAASDGVLVHELEPGAADRFRVEAARFWHDVEPVLRPAYERYLQQLGP